MKWVIRKRLPGSPDDEYRKSFYRDFTCKTGPGRQVRGQESFEIYPEDDIVFYLTVVAAEVSFQSGEGTVESLILFQDSLFLVYGESLETEPGVGNCSWISCEICRLTIPPVPGLVFVSVLSARPSPGNGPKGAW